MNKDMFQIARSWMALVVTALAMTACEYKELVDGQDPDNRVPVEISFDWQNVDSIPSRMQVMFYRNNESGYQRCDVGNGTSTILHQENIISRRGITTAAIYIAKVITAKKKSMPRHRYSTLKAVSVYYNFWILSIRDRKYWIIQTIWFMETC